MQTLILSKLSVSDSSDQFLESREATEETCLKDVSFVVLETSIPCFFGLK